MDWTTMSGITLIVDYLEFSIRYDSMYALLEMMPGELTVLEGGWKGHKESVLISGGLGRVSWTLGQLCQVSLPSKCLRELARLDDRFADLAGFIGTVQDDWDGNIGRIDVAWDDRRGVLDMDVIREALEDRAYTSRWRGGFEVRGWGNQEGSRCIYLGSRKSDAQLRLYNKAKEQCVKSHWVRVELQARRSRADALAAVYKRLNEDADGVMAELAGILIGYVTFREPTGHSNRSRWPIAPWWAEFLGGAERAQLGRRETDRTVEDIQGWIAHQVAPSLAVVELAMGAEAMWCWLHERVEAAKPRLGPRHRAIIAAAEEKLLVERDVGLECEDGQ